MHGPELSAKNAAGAMPSDDLVVVVGRVPRLGQVDARRTTLSGLEDVERPVTARRPEVRRRLSGFVYGGTGRSTPGSRSRPLWTMPHRVVVSRMPNRRMEKLAGKFCPGTTWRTWPVFGLKGFDSTWMRSSRRVAVPLDPDLGRADELECRTRRLPLLVDAVLEAGHRPLVQLHEAREVHRLALAGVVVVAEDDGGSREDVRLQWLGFDVQRLVGLADHRLPQCRTHLATSWLAVSAPRSPRDAYEDYIFFW